MIIIIIIVWVAVWAFLGYNAEKAKPEEVQIIRTKQRMQAAGDFTIGVAVGSSRVFREVMKDGE